MKVYGPYFRKDGRQHVIKIDETGKRQTQSYPRFLMEKLLDQELLPNEEVDHRDDDCSNNSIYNLQILIKTDNHHKELNRPERQANYYFGICPECNKEFEKRMNQVKANWKKGKVGPFCSKSCASKRNARIQFSKS